MNPHFTFKSITSYSKLLLGAAICFSSCENPGDLPEPHATSAVNKVQTANSLGTKTFYGPATPLGQGVAKAWVSTDKQGNPLSVGITVSEHAVEALLKGQGHDHQSFTLKLPKQGEKTLYNHIVLDWNPMGHPAPGIYDLPHFDLHAYMISEEERMAIVPMAPFDANGQISFDDRPSPLFIPKDYALDPGIVPAMGAHWLDQMAPELNGETFTQTYIYGSYKGEFIFHEPMFTVAYLKDLKQKSNPFASYAIKQPESYQKAGYYPMEYSFTYNPTPGEYIISLDKLVYKN
ncbi:hypothetical protein D770_11380 [Flammeovirgaceae bacterium 311]|nr:hypothetical protein D770_11380 [Flammeovirgaceae bacterium 311]